MNRTWQAEKPGITVPQPPGYCWRRINISSLHLLGTYLFTKHYAFPHLSAPSPVEERKPLQVRQMSAEAGKCSASIPSKNRTALSEGELEANGSHIPPPPLEQGKLNIKNNSRKIQIITARWKSTPQIRFTIRSHNHQASPHWQVTAKVKPGSQPRVRGSIRGCHLTGDHHSFRLSSRNKSCGLILNRAAGSMREGGGPSWGWSGSWNALINALRALTLLSYLHLHSHLLFVGVLFI